MEPESETVEYKEAWQKDHVEDLAALANTRGGTLRVGVRDDGTLCGWKGTAREEEAIANQIVDTLGIHPRRMEVEPQEAGPVLAIVMAQAAAPVSVRGRYYRRVGNTTREVPEEERVRFLLERTGGSWDELPTEAGLSEISQKTLADFRVLSGKRLPRLAPTDTPEAILDKLNLREKNGRLKRGALMAFGQSPQRFFRSAEVQVGRFRDDTTILDEQPVHGNLFQQLEMAMQAIRGYLLVRYAIPQRPAGRSTLEDLQRQEIWEFPFAAVREALLNALVHRDYTRKGSIQVRVYDDRLTVHSPGGLMEGLTVADLFEEPHDSLRRNPVLAEIMYYVNFVERWGTGTLRMRDACRLQGAPDPEFISTENNFTVVLRKGKLPQTSTKTATITGEERKILEWAASREQFSITEYSEAFGVPQRQARYLVQRLVQKGMLRPEGESRARRYFIEKV